VGLLGRRKGAAAESPAADADADAELVEPGSASKTTAPKGRPTPKRDAARRRGPVAPAPMTTGEARRRRKELGSKLSRVERREVRATQRERMAERRQKMMAGEEAYLLPRDQGPVRHYVRDVVDSRRNLLGLFMPMAFGMILVMLSVPAPQVQLWITPAMMLLFVIMIVDGFFLGRKINKMVDQKFPKNTESGWKLGFYAASRASQLRRMRAPRPQVERGTKVT